MKSTASEPGLTYRNISSKLFYIGGNLDAASSPDPCTMSFSRLLTLYKAQMHVLM